jgi:hypothetical protein
MPTADRVLRAGELARSYAEIWRGCEAVLAPGLEQLLRAMDDARHADPDCTEFLQLQMADGTFFDADGQLELWCWNSELVLRKDTSMSEFALGSKFASILLPEFRIVSLESVDGETLQAFRALNRVQQDLAYSSACNLQHAITTVCNMAADARGLVKDRPCLCKQKRIISNKLGSPGHMRWIDKLPEDTSSIRNVWGQTSFLFVCFVGFVFWFVFIYYCLRAAAAGKNLRLML